MIESEPQTIDPRHKKWDIICKECPNITFTKLIPSQYSFLHEIYTKLNYNFPSPIQIATIPIGLASRNILAQSKSGTGKTIAFLSIVFAKLIPNNNTQAIISLPTRELTNQVFQQAHNINQFLSEEKRICIKSVIGGFPISEDQKNFKQKMPDLVIGTSGRINEIFQRGGFSLDGLKIFVMDEADILIKMKDFNKLYSKVNFRKKNQAIQYLCFSATYSDKNFESICRNVCPVVKIHNSILVDKEGNKIENNDICVKSPIMNTFKITQIDPITNNDELQIEQNRTDNQNEQQPKTDNTEDILAQKKLDLISEINSENKESLNISRLKQYSIKITTNNESNLSIYRQKQHWIIFLLKNIKHSQCIIFYNDKGRGDQQLAELEEFDLNKNALYIHGEMSQHQRIRLMNRIKLRNVRIIIATDLLSRGIDIESIDLVINLDEPYNSETYFHRIGRAGRFGNYGASFMFIHEKTKNNFMNDEKYVYQIEEFPIQNSDAQITIQEDLNGLLAKQVDTREDQKHIIDLGVDSSLGEWTGQEKKNFNVNSWKYYDASQKNSFLEEKDNIDEILDLDSKENIKELELLEKELLGGCLTEEVMSKEGSFCMDLEVPEIVKENLLRKRDDSEFLKGNNKEDIALSEKDRNFIRKMVNCKNCKKLVEDFDKSFGFGEDFLNCFVV